MEVPHLRFFTPKDLLSQVLWYSYHKSCSREEAIRRLSYIREIKQWLMSGNPMLIEDCEEKCKQWAKRFPIRWDFSHSGTFYVSMQYVSFVYSWDRQNAHVLINTEAAKALGWKESEYVLKGKHCPDLEKVFTLNERLQNAVVLPSLVKWCEQEGIYDKKKQEFHELLKQLNWWSSTLQNFCMFDVKLCSTRKLLNHLPIDDELAVKAWIEGEQFEMFRFNSHDSIQLDRMFAIHYLPKLRARMDFLHECIGFLKRNKETEASFPLDIQPEGFSFYKGFGNDVLKEDKREEYLRIYNTICDAATHLWNDMGYNSRLCYFQMDIPTKSDNEYHFYFSCGTKYSSVESTDKLFCKPEELNDKFPEFYEKFKKKAIATAENAISRLDMIVLAINKRINS